MQLRLQRGTESDEVLIVHVALRCQRLCCLHTNGFITKQSFIFPSQADAWTFNGQRKKWHPIIFCLWQWKCFVFFVFFCRMLKSIFGRLLHPVKWRERFNSPRVAALCRKGESSHAFFLASDSLERLVELTIGYK